MFEAILERILLQTLGDYLDGIDRSKLSLEIWNGQVDFENISVKPNVIGKLKMPFKMEFSQVRKLSIRLPWKKITTAPVEILIDGLFLIISPLEREDWQPSDYSNAIKKLQKLNEMEEKFKSKFKDAIEKPGEDKNFAKKLVKRIIDNIQVSAFLKFPYPF